MSAERQQGSERTEAVQTLWRARLGTALSFHRIGQRMHIKEFVSRREMLGKAWVRSGEAG